MKYDERKAFPHPVLCPYNNDYSEGRFEAEVAYELDESGSDVQVELELNLKQPLIEDCLDSGKAQYTIVVYSRDTYYRDVHFGTNDKETFLYSDGKLGGSVVVSSFITAKTDISGYSSPDFDKEFGSAEFQIKAGDVLALDEQKQFHVGLEPFQEIRAVWALVVQPSIKMGSFEVGLDGELIEILVHPNQKRILDPAMTQRDGQSLMVNSIILPALIHVLDAMSLEGREYEDLKWYQVMFGQCIRHGIDIHNEGLDCLKAAQKLLELPLTLLNKTHLKGE